MESIDALANATRTGEDYLGNDPRTGSNPRRSDDGRLMYHENMVQPVPGYHGPLREIPFADVRTGLKEALRYTGVASWGDVPLPPAGLPGKLHEEYDDSEDAFRLLVFGIDYVKAVAFNERRTMHNRWKEAREFIRKIEERAVQAYISERASLYCDQREQALAEQKVYFIASESGPIKIGIAGNPCDRLKGLQTSHHERLAILVVCDGGADQERAYHRQFAAHRLHGEWFERHPDILAEIERLLAIQEKPNE